MTIGLPYKPNHISLPDTSSYFPRNVKSPNKTYSTNPMDSPIISPLISSPRSPCGSGVKSYFTTSDKQPSPGTESFARFDFLGTKNCKSKRPATPSMKQMQTSSEPIPTNFIEVTPESLAELLQSNHLNNVLVIDMRSFVQYSCSHISDAVNLCVPNTLLKRVSFGIEKLAESLLAEKDRKTVQNWMCYSSIVIYDANSEVIADNTPIAHLGRKFLARTSSTSIGWLKGGFNAFIASFPNLCQVISTAQTTTPARKPLLSPSSFLAAPLTCPTPTGNMATPFFNNIRPHHDVTCELGEIVAIRTPAKFQHATPGLPPFLVDVAYNPQGKYKLSQTFKRIDKIEQKRLHSLLVAQTHHVSQSNPYSIGAGIERGSKNRYNNIWPYEHSRVKLEHAGRSDSDYINASFVGGKGSSNRYIATQGPMPSTFPDFWEMVWEQNSRVIVMLTKEEEVGRIKCHRYWPNSITSPAIKYGDNIEVKLMSESQPLHTDPTLTLRTLTLINSQTHEERQIFQLHFIGWPDFGIPTDPSGVLGLRDIAHDIQKSQAAGPMIVHCSAGCGRTGAFCTIDTVLEILTSKVNSSGSTIEEDLIAEIVDQFRDQRLSMVQTLRQFVFCYEAVLWRLMGAPSCERVKITSKPNEPSFNIIQPNVKTPQLEISEAPLKPSLPAMSVSNIDYLPFPPSHNTSLSFNDPRRTSYFG